ncbi:hypothetical protein [Polyangium jinanense]|uniref:Uncharacterized protein n=1 Tax=Polyangium jinanense TaxID=2829994 RepID=A0A9X3XH68_9BACT|nr:hypothetical protein [Polyangium jinanense]MDC3960249.1 hypothetical protein [Polyangium jinanense]MDC3988031.1 hypothetical protein [Polyangium jinanense]
MTGPHTIAIDEPFDDVDEELRHTELTAKAYPETAPLAEPFAVLRAELRKRKAEEDALLDAIAFAKALMVAADDVLNVLVDETKKAVLAAYNQDFKAPLYRQLFEGQSPSDLKRPILGAQLETMRAWVGPLGAANVPTLGAIAQKLSHAIVKADDAVTKTSLAEQAMDTFVAGPRTELINGVNALRKLTAGQIGELVHASLEGKVPRDFVDRFFLSSGGSRTPTLAELSQSITRLEAKLERQKALLASMKEKEAKLRKAKQEAELTEKQAKLAAAEKRAAEAAQEIARLKAEMGST